MTNGLRKYEGLKPLAEWRSVPYVRLRGQTLPLAVLVFLPLAHSVQAAPRYRITDLGPGQATAINDRGDVVGIVPHGAVQALNHPLGTAFLWTHGHRRDLPTLGGPYAGVFAINNREEAVGIADTARIVQDTGNPHGRRVRHAVLWRNGQASDLHSHISFRNEPFPSSIAVSINNRKETLLGFDDSRIYVLASGKATPLAGSSGYALRSEDHDYYGVDPVAINDNGVKAINVWVGSMSCVGRLYTRQGRNFLSSYQPKEQFPSNAIRGLNRYGDAVGNASYSPCLWIAGHPKATLLQTACDSDFTCANAINDKRLIVGGSMRVVGDFNSQHPLEKRCALLWSGHKVYDLNHLLRDSHDWTLQEATGINNRGQIAGNGVLQGHHHAFLLTPIPTGGNR